MKLFKFTILMVWLVACGGEASLEEELGQLEAGLTARNGHGLNMNNAPPNEGSQCGSTSDCRFPDNKVVTFSCGLGFTAAEATLCQTIVDQEVQALKDQFGGAGWQFGRVNHPNGEVTFTKGDTGGAPSVLDIRGFVTLSANTCGPALAESPAIAGTYRRCGRLNTLVDWAEIDAKFSNASDRIRVKSHSIGMIAAAAVGVGYTSTTTDRKNSIQITQTAAKQITLRSGDQCKVLGYDPTGDVATTVGGC